MMEQDFGVCRLSAVPVRSSAGNSLPVYQLLFGEAYEVLEKSKDKLWLRIRNNFDGVEGWINARHHVSIPLEYFEQLTQSDFKITTDIVSTILYKKNPLSILMGSIVPISSAELFKMDEQFAFNGEAKPLSVKRDAEFLKVIAIKYMHAPETEGGKSPFGISCNGFVQMVFKIAGYTLPWSLNDQARAGKKVADIFSALPGDLAFFKNGSGEIHHVGLVLEDNKIIHASGQVKIDLLTEEGILNADTKIYTHTLAGLQRIVNH
jgi:hypothetical protein